MSSTSTNITNVPPLSGGKADAKKTLRPKKPLKESAGRGNMALRLGVFIAIATVLSVLYMTIEVDPKIFDYTMKLRSTKLIGILLAAFCIGTATIVFQTIIKNRIVTPCLLGMNSLYILLHTTLAFILGASSPFVSDRNIAFVIDIVIMGIVGTIIYSLLMKKTNYNILYVLLSGTIMATLFGSISDAMAVLIDPNEYETLLNTLIAGFDHINAEIFISALVLISLTLAVFWKDIKMLNILTLGREYTVNLGVDFDRATSRLLVAVVLMITIATALVGPISFLGLITANIARESFKTYKHSYLMICSFLVGAIVLLFGQILIEHLLHFSTAVTVMVSLFGGIYFLYLILSKNKGAL